MDRSHRQRGPQSWIRSGKMSLFILLSYCSGASQCRISIKLMSDRPSVSYEKLFCEKLVYKLHTQPSKFPLRATWRMTEMTIQQQPQLLINVQHFNHMTSSFSYRIDQCCNLLNILIREKTLTRTYHKTGFLCKVFRMRNFNHLTSALDGARHRQVGCTDE